MRLLQHLRTKWLIWRRGVRTSDGRYVLPKLKYAKVIRKKQPATRTVAGWLPAEIVLPELEAYGSGSFMQRHGIIAMRTLESNGWCGREKPRRMIQYELTVTPDSDIERLLTADDKVYGIRCDAVVNEQGFAGGGQ